MDKNKDKFTLAKSFACAGKGVVSAFTTERNIRIHCCALFYVVRFSVFYDFTAGEKALLALAVGLVISAELLNTAVETVVDLVTQKHERLAGLAKDIAAGGVLVSAFSALAAGLFLFLEPATVKEILSYYLERPLHCALLGISVAVWLVVIFLPERKKNKREADK